MSNIKIKRALIAVYDKTGIIEFARTLVDEFGIEIISTGGTAKHLKDAGVPVTMVEQVTGFPEMLDGRVKTLHPMIHAGILADRDKPDHMRQLAEHGIKPIDMVVVNLYPFEQTIAKPDCKFEDAIEMIDIGGPCMLRAAAKNHKHVVVLCNQGLYAKFLSRMRSQGSIDEHLRQTFAGLVFNQTNKYDAAIAAFFLKTLEEDTDERFGSRKPLPLVLGMGLKLLQESNYGENPHQTAGAYLPVQSKIPPESTLVTGKQLAGSTLSFNNYVDGDSALSLVKELSRAFCDPRASARAVPETELDLTKRNSAQAKACGSLGKKHAVAFIKHTNACGCAIGDDPVDTYRRAYLGDPIAAAGGVLCVNFPVTRAFAEVVMNSYGSWGKSAGAAFFKLDVWIAPSFDEDAVALITTPTEKRKWGASCRLLAVGSMDAPPNANEMDYKKITGGMLVQTRDLIGLNEDQWKVVSKRQPTEKEMADLRFAWLICKHTKSNAITIVRDGMLLGNGAGQMSRVKSCDLAIQLARENEHGDKLPGAIAAGDAFFPVEDGPKKLIAAGITAVIHPGGSNRDADSIRVCDESNVAMIMTGTRHFKH